MVSSSLFSLSIFSWGSVSGRLSRNDSVTRVLRLATVLLVGDGWLSPGSSSVRDLSGKMALPGQGSLV